MDLSEFITLMERSDFDHTTDDATGSNILSSNVEEERVLIPIGMVISETSGAANTVDVDKVEEDGTTTPILPGFNLGANETRVLSMMGDGAILPRLEGGTNISVTAGTDGVEATLVWVHNVY